MKSGSPSSAKRLNVPSASTKDSPELRLTTSPKSLFGLVRVSIDMYSASFLIAKSRSFIKVEGVSTVLLFPITWMASFRSPICFINAFALFTLSSICCSTSRSFTVMKSPSVFTRLTRPWASPRTELREVIFVGSSAAVCTEAKKRVTAPLIELASLAKTLSKPSARSKKACASPTLVVSRRNWFIANWFNTRSVKPRLTPPVSSDWNSVRSRT